MAALKSFRAAKGAYPDASRAWQQDQGINGPPCWRRLYRGDTPSIRRIPKPPTTFSVVGNAFGLLLHQTSGPCIVEVGASKTGWWGQPPPCKLLKSVRLTNAAFLISPGGALPLPRRSGRLLRVAGRDMVPQRFPRSI